METLSHAPWDTNCPSRGTAEVVSTKFEVRRLCRRDIPRRARRVDAEVRVRSLVTGPCSAIAAYQRSRARVEQVVEVEVEVQVRERRHVRSERRARRRPSPDSFGYRLSVRHKLAPISAVPQLCFRQNGPDAPSHQILYGKMVQLNYEHSGAPIAQDIELPYETPPR